jgi:hypothetical protein
MSELSSPPITLAVLGQVYCCFKLACDVTDFEAYTNLVIYGGMITRKVRTGKSLQRTHE